MGPESILSFCDRAVNLQLHILVSLGPQWVHRFIFVCVSARWSDGMRVCVCICRRIREWDPRIHSLECEVCVLSSPRARNVSQTHCNNF